MTTSDTNGVSLPSDLFTSPSAPSPTQPPSDTISWQTLGSTSVFRSGSGEEEPLVEAVFSWDELWEVRQVENVLTPLVVTLIAVSNLTLLVHEARLVWRTQHIIQPKLLVVALCSADLMATLVGFLPLWVLFVMPQEAPRHGDSHAGSSPGASPDGSSPDSLVNSSTLSTNQTSAVVPEVTAAHFTSVSPGGSSLAKQPAAHTIGYSVVLFLLTSFWTLAQCIVVVMGVERFLALRFPFFYTARCTCGVFLAVLGVLALVSCGVGSFHLVVQLEELEGDPLVFAGFLDSRSLPHNVFSLVQGLVWSVVLLLCNWAVTRELRRMEQRVTLVRMKDQREYMKQFSMVHGAGREFARFMMAVNVIFLLSSSPNLICVLLRLFNLAPRFSIQYFCWRMSHTSALLNPFLYGFLRKSLRSRIRRFLNQHLPCLRSQRIAEEELGPVVRDQNECQQTARAHRSDANSAIVPRDPEASAVYLSE